MLDERARAGFVLAALLHDDRALAKVAGALAPEPYRETRAWLTAHADTRPRLVAELLEHVRPALRELAPTLPARMNALLAQHLRRSPTRSELAAPARADFIPSRELVACLVRIARAASRAEDAP